MYRRFLHGSRLSWTGVRREFYTCGNEPVLKHIQMTLEASVCITFIPVWITVTADTNYLFISTQTLNTFSFHSGINPDVNCRFDSDDWCDYQDNSPTSRNWFRSESDAEPGRFFMRSRRTDDDKSIRRLSSPVFEVQVLNEIWHSLCWQNELYSFSCQRTYL